MAVNKVVINNETKIDLSSDTIDTASVVSGKTFHNSEGVSSTGTFAAQTKTVTSSRSAQTVTPDSGKYLSQVNVNALEPTGTYTFPANDTGGTKDMGSTSNYRYVNAQNVYNKGVADADAAFTAILTITTPNSRLYNRTITITKN
jgi:hypothetical protein